MTKKNHSLAIRTSVLLPALILAGILLLPAAGSAKWGKVLDKIKTKATQGAREMNINFTPEQERYIGRAVAANVIQQYGIYKDDRDLKKYVNLVGTWVANFSDRPDIPYHFEILDSDEINAYAAPAGYIFITVGMLRALGNEAELAGVLAHEVSHVARNHGMNLIKDEYRKKYMTKTAVETGAELSGASPELVARFSALTDTLTKTLLVNGYSRELEYEADRYGTETAAAAGYDPRGIRLFLETLAAQESGPRTGKLEKMKKTHPTAKARIEKLDEEFGEEPAGDRKDLQDRFLKRTAAIR
jgi:predicted Zn-dependent protease